MARQNIVIRIAGESGEGVISTGDFLVQAAARAGFHVLTFKTFPAEIKGGHAVFQARFSTVKIHTQGDSVDVLLAFNEEAYQKHYKDIASGGTMLYDSSEFEPAEKREDVNHTPAPLSSIAKDELKFALGKNVVAVGLAAELFGLDPAVIETFITEKFTRKGEDVVAKNLAALQAGREFTDSHVQNLEDFIVSPPEKRDDAIVLNGNQALSLGAMQYGLKNYFGYPITPASEIMEFLAAQLPKVGGVVVQAEDEIAAMGMCLGSSYMGAPVMTATSGPGLSLMVEMIGLSGMAELPVVIVDVQRGGPSTGLPTKHEQSDLNLAAYGGHGDSPRIVIAPTTVEDCFYCAIQAFNLAEKYQMPVIILSDQTLATRTDCMPPFDLNKVTIEKRALYNNGQDNGDETYFRYVDTETGVSPMSLPGQRGGRYVATGLEHGEAASPKYDPLTHTKMMDKRYRKIAHAKADYPGPECYGTPGAKIGLVGWGSTLGYLCEAIDQAKAQGIEVEAIAPRVLFPIDPSQFEAFLEGKERIIVAEVNKQGQFAKMLRSVFPREFESLLTYGGEPFKVRDILNAITGKEAAHV